MPEARIQKVLADAGVASRRAAEALVAAGRVTVNGRPARIGEAVDRDRDALAVDGQPVGRRGARVHLALDKPAGVTSTVRDPHAATSVLRFVPDELLARAGRLYPVGRLDRGSEGLLLLTNDGPWAERVLHPRYGVEREYAVAVGRPLQPEQARALERGVWLEEGRARLALLRPATSTELRRLAASISPPPAPGLTWYRATLTTGWKRQLRRMFAAVGLPVLRLVRVRIGTIRLDGMRAGEVRELTSRDAVRLAGLARRSAAEAGRTSPDGPEAGLVVSLDGPASSGKSSVGAAASRELGYRFCDTGLLYRALTWLALHRGLDLDEPDALVAAVPDVRLVPDAEGRLTRVRVGRRDVTALVHGPDVDRSVSRVSRHPHVRDALRPVQRAIAAGGRIVMAGRDIGTVVLPDADLKLYLDAPLAERARRRAEERGIVPGSAADLELTAELRRRDERDRAQSRIPPDALVIRSDGNTFAETVAEVVAAIREREHGVPEPAGPPGE